MGFLFQFRIVRVLMGILCFVMAMAVIAIMIHDVPDKQRRDTLLKRLLVSGVKAQATIVDGVSVNGFASLNYQYVATDSQGYTSRQQGFSAVPESVFESAKKGQVVPIRYLADQPDFSAMVGYEGDPNSPAQTIPPPINIGSFAVALRSVSPCSP